MEQVVKRARFALHDRRPAVNDLLHPVPVFPRNDGFMRIFHDFPLIPGDDIVGVGTDALLVRAADYMIALVYRIPSYRPLGYFMYKCTQSTPEVTEVVHRETESTIRQNFRKSFL